MGNTHDAGAEFVAPAGYSEEFAVILGWVLGDVHAATFLYNLLHISHVWDDLIDQDEEYSPDAVNRAFWIALIEVPKNPFFRAYCDQLLPVMQTAILNWHVANKLEVSGGRDALEIAHVLRDGLADVVLMAARLLGGPDWATSVGPDIRTKIQGVDDLSVFKGDIK